jgi:predicted ArsR family transcriptional regulator
MKIDATNGAICNVLINRPGASIRQIADAVGLSPTPVRDRLLWLDKAGVIHYDGGGGKARMRDNVIIHCYNAYEVVHYED